MKPGEFDDHEDQAYFWTEYWQRRILEAEADIQAGRTFLVTGGNLEAGLDWLDENEGVNRPTSGHEYPG